MTSGLSSASLTEHLTILRNFFSLLPGALSFFLIVIITAACDSSELKEPIEYTGPLRKVENVQSYYTEKDRIKAKLVAAEMEEFDNLDRSFPKGIYLEFYNEFGKLESTLRANEAYYFKKEDRWRARGKVEVKNLEKNEQLNTEELFWVPRDEKIYTDKFVTIRQQDDVIYGEGLEADQDMSNYSIKKITGEFQVEE